MVEVGIRKKKLGSQVNPSIDKKRRVVDGNEQGVLSGRRGTGGGFYFGPQILHRTVFKKVIGEALVVQPSK